MSLKIPYVRPILIALVTASLASAADRPNILFCFSDDWGRYAGMNF